MTPETAADVAHRAQEVVRLLESVCASVEKIGRLLDGARAQLPTDLYRAWLLAELHWALPTADAFESFIGARRTVEAIDFATQLAPRCVALRHLVRSGKLLQSYRDIVRGEPLARLVHRRKLRVRRAVLRRRAAPSNDDSAE
jgi:hypothetical protein